MKEIAEITQFLYEIPKFTTKNGLEHTKQFLRELGNPGESLTIIHVAGSNGKGSVCCFLSNMLRQTGKKVGLFTSPHLVDVRERFQINGKMVTEEQFCEAFALVKEKADDFVRRGLQHPTFFEFIFAMAMVMFEHEQVDYLVLETGLGGRLDATNSISGPALTVITSLSLEHTEILGDTIEKIAFEKAGILKKGVSVVYDENNPAAGRVICERAEELNCPVHAVKPQMYRMDALTERGISFSLADPEGKVTKWEIPFAASYQVENAATAITAMRVLMKQGIASLTEEQMQQGLMQSRWPGRMQEVQPDIYFDGAHNTSGITVFLDAVKKLTKDDKYPPLLLFSMVKEKDYHTSVELLTGGMDWEAVVVTTIPNVRGLPYEVLLELFEEDTTGPVSGCADYREAFAAVKARKKEGQKLFCTGSLYFVGALMELV